MSIYESVSLGLQETPWGSDQRGVWASVGSDVRKPTKGRKNLKLKGIWNSLEASADIGNYRPRLSTDIEVKEFHLKWGNDYAVIFNPRDIIHYRLEPGELELLSWFDGTKTVREIIVERFEQTGELELSGIADLVRQLEFGNFLDKPFLDVDAAVKQAIKPKLNLERRLAEFARTLTVEWKGAERLVAWFYRRGFKFLFSRYIQIPLALICAAGLLSFFKLAQASHFRLLDRSAAQEGLVLIGLSYTLTFVHELSHALVLHHNGRRVKSAGFLIYFGSTAFYIESTDGMMMERKQRILMSFAGPYSEMIIAGIVSVIAFMLPDWPFSKTLYKFALLNYFVIFMNLIPLLELDGYWIFSELIQVPNLRKMSLDFVRYDLWHKLRTRERISKQQVGLGLYGILGVAFTILSLYSSTYFWRKIFGGIFTKLWSGGPLGRGLLLTLVLFVAGPLIKGAIRLVQSIWRRVDAGAKAIRFRLQTRWRVEAAELIDQMPMFEGLSLEALEDLAGRVTLRRIESGKPVVRQGDFAEAFYVVRKGTLQIVEEDHTDGSQKTLRILGRGEGFGELGLINRSARAATVRALETSEVFEVDRSSFERLLESNIALSDFAPTIHAIIELRQMSAFSHLEADEVADLLRYGEWVNIPPNQTVLKQGEVGDAFYAMRTGQVDVIKNRKTITTLGPDSYFGEVALLLDVVRTATVRTRTPVRAFKVSRDGFNRLVKTAFGKGTLNPQTPMTRVWEH
ncbi:MAG: cyclic nucleotide-binding domain-containing protein [Actinobacteria bacterium]|nr:cyclic nucleotide-binding domain-containing protein [Actinomycetota bacterium]